MTSRPTFAALAAPHRFRVRLDDEGWPIIPGRYGRLEYHDAASLAVYTDRPRLVARLWGVPASSTGPSPNRKVARTAVHSQLMDPVPSAAGTLAVLKGAKHPHAAMLLTDFMLSREGRQIMAQAEYFPAHPEI